MKQNDLILPVRQGRGVQKRVTIPPDVGIEEGDYVKVEKVGKK